MNAYDVHTWYRDYGLAESDKECDSHCLIYIFNILTSDTVNLKERRVTELGRAIFVDGHLLACVEFCHVVSSTIAHVPDRKYTSVILAVTKREFLGDVISFLSGNVEAIVLGRAAKPMKYEKLVTTVMVLFRGARAEFAVSVTKGTSIGFKCKFATLRQITTYRLIALVHLHGIT